MRVFLIIIGIAMGISALYAVFLAIAVFFEMRKWK